MIHKVLLSLVFLSIAFAVSMLVPRHSKTEVPVVPSNARNSVMTQQEIQSSNNEKPEFVEIEFSDSRTGFGLSDDRLRLSELVGKTWEIRFSGAEARPAPFGNYRNQEQVLDFQFLSPETGWLLTDSNLLQTEDRGRSWKAIRTPDIVAYSVYFLSSRIGWLAGEKLDPKTSEWESVLFLTRDGGQTWKKNNLGMNRQVPYVGGFYNVCMSSQEDVWVIGDFIYHSRDLGMSWKKVEFDGDLFGNLTDIKFIGRHYGLITTNQGSHFLVTADGGRHWRSRSFEGFKRGLPRLTQSDDGVLWAIGNDGIYQSGTEDSEWKKVKDGSFSAIEFVAAEKTLVIIGETGVVEATSNLGLR